MSDSLKDQLLKLGFKNAPPPAPPRKPETKPTQRATPHDTPNKTREKPRRSEDFDLARAYAMRARKEKDERIAAERERQEEARRRREGKAKLAELLQRVRRNDEAAELARHFEYGGKIRRIYVTAEQLRALNAGELSVVQLAGRYHLVAAADGEEAERLLPGSLALRAGVAEPDAPEGYDDPLFQVPDDLLW